MHWQAHLDPVTVPWPSSLTTHIASGGGRQQPRAAGRWTPRPAAAALHGRIPPPPAAPCTTALQSARQAAWLKFNMRLPVLSTGMLRQAAKLCGGRRGTVRRPAATGCGATFSASSRAPGSCKHQEHKPDQRKAGRDPCASGSGVGEVSRLQAGRLLERQDGQHPSESGQPAP